MTIPSLKPQNVAQQTEAQKQREKLSQTLDEGERAVKEMTERIRTQHEKLEQERLEREQNEAPWWVPVGMLLALGAIMGALAWYERRRRRYAKAKMIAFVILAQEIVALILEDAEELTVWAKIRELRIAESDQPAFMKAYDLALMTLPIPWYREDVPQWRQKLVKHFIQQNLEPHA